MYKFILVTFGFLTWGFYEMSGGADFEPASARLAAQQTIVAEALATSSDTPAQTSETTSQSAFVDTDPPLSDEAEVTRISLNLTSLEDVQTATAETVGADEVVAGESDEAAVPRNAAFEVSSATTPAIIPSLIDPNDGVLTESTSETANLLDLRVVTGTRVNVRSGPGTQFGVVSKLVEGDEVEILEDNGNGWVRLRPVGDGPIGWMADFLLTSG